MNDTTRIPTYPFSVPPLRFAYDALEPYVDKRTMRLHHDRHHAAYVDGLNATLKSHPELHGKSIEAILRELDRVSESIRAAVREHGGGHANPQFFWKVIGAPGTAPRGEMLSAIETDFGSFEHFKSRFTEMADGHSASGRAFLVPDPRSGRLEVRSPPTRDSVLTRGEIGLLLCDLREHAYYLKYEERRAEYLAALRRVVDWDVVGARLRAFRAGACVV